MRPKSFAMACAFIALSLFAGRSEAQCKSCVSIGAGPYACIDTNNHGFSFCFTDGSTCWVNGPCDPYRPPLLTAIWPDGTVVFEHARTARGRSSWQQAVTSAVEESRSRVDTSTVVGARYSRRCNGVVVSRTYTSGLAASMRAKSRQIVL